MKALICATLLALASPVAMADDILVTASDGSMALVAPDGTWASVLVGTGEDDRTYLLFPDGTWQVREIAVSAVEQQFRDAVDTALSRFEPDLEGAEREMAMTCLMSAFAALSDEDMQMLIDVGFDPDRAMQDRLEETYPGMNRAVERCI